MSSTEKKNVAASVQQRLLNRAKAEEKKHQELLQYYMMERFLYRMSVSDYSSLLVLKGALTLQIWDVQPRRVTKDVDLLGEQVGNESDVRAMIKEIIELPVEEDGMTYYPDTMTVQLITKKAGYPGFRVKLKGGLGKPQLVLQMDIGIGDAVTLEPELISYPTLLDYPEPKILVYRRETAIAEKFQAMVQLAKFNSRMKDYYDLWLLSQQFDFEPEVLGIALKATFERRETALPQTLDSLFTSDLTEALESVWKRYHRSNQLGENVQDFRAVIQGIKAMIQPALAWALKSES